MEGPGAPKKRRRAAADDGVGVEDSGGAQDEESRFSALVETEHELERLDRERVVALTQLQWKFWQLQVPLFRRRAAAALKLEGYWPRVLAAHPVIRSLLTDHDAQVLQQLADVSVECNFEDDVLSWTLRLTFDQDNEWFDAPLWKKCESVEWNGPLDIAQSSGLPFRSGVSVEPFMGEADGEGRPDRVTLDTSFFGYFDASEKDTQLMEIFRDEIWPQPTAFYLSVMGDGEDGDVDVDVDDEGDVNVDDDVDVDVGENSEGDGDGAGDDGDDAEQDVLAMQVVQQDEEVTDTDTMG